MNMNQNSFNFYKSSHSHLLILLIVELKFERRQNSQLYQTMSIGIFSFPLVIFHLLFCQIDFFSLFIKIVIHSFISKRLRSVNWHFSLRSFERFSSLCFFSIIHQHFIKTLDGQFSTYSWNK